jgi:hypothetical protein
LETTTHSRMLENFEIRGQTLLLLSLYMHQIYPMSGWTKAIVGPMALIAFCLLLFGLFATLWRYAKEQA